MPLTSRYSYEFSFFGFRGNGTVLGISSEYHVHPVFEKNFFNGEIMKVNKEANKKDSSYWNRVRLVPLTGEESRDYVKRDSSHQLHESKAYRDSVDRKNNKFDFSNIFFGYGYENSFQHWDVSVSSLISSIQFNTVEGWNGGLTLHYRKRFGDDDRREKNISSNLHYGLSNRHINGTISYDFRYNPQQHSFFRAVAGTEVTQFNGNKPISELVNSGYTLFAEKNFMKIYEKRFVEVYHRSEIMNGLRLAVAVEYAQRLPLFNTTSYKFVNVAGREYTSNDPLNTATDRFHFVKNNSLRAEADVRIRFRQEYVTRPEGTFITGSKFPEVRVSYKKGIHAVSSDVDYDLIRTGISDNIRFGLFGKLNYEAFYGKFLTKKLVSFMDASHFNGNKTFFSGFRLNDFKLLDYYQYSTTDPFVEVHAEHNFSGFILNKIPLVRKLKLSEIAGFHFLHTELLKSYAEFSVGLEKLNVLRIDFVTSFAAGKKVSAGFVFGLKGVF